MGICIRESSNSSHKDWYEPNEPELERDGLPIWPLSLVQEQQYLRKESFFNGGVT